MLQCALSFLRIGRAAQDPFEVLENVLDVQIAGLEAGCRYSISSNTCFGRVWDTHSRGLSLPDSMQLP